jgi:ethanolamine ammonia-lyase small subunit
MTDFDRLRRTTPARLDVGRAGSRPRTATLLDFRRAHAAARDAVWSEWSDTFVVHLERLGFLIVASAAPDRQTYVLNPPLGRQLASGEAERIRAANGQEIPAAPLLEKGGSVSRSKSRQFQGEREFEGHTLQVVLSDGLSAVAGETHCDAVVPRLLDALRRLARVAVPVAVRNGRVAVADAVAQASGTTLVVHLIGERPGLATAESLGCYLTYVPGPSTTDADRKCISNIHAAGLNPTEAAATIAGVTRRIFAARTSGIDLIL